MNKAARAMRVRQAQFNDSLTAREIPGQKAWRVNFHLSEVLSVPEKTEQRQQAQNAETQSAAGQTVTAGAQGDTDTGESEELTGFEKILAWADDRLAPDDETDTATADTTDATA